MNNLELAWNSFCKIDLSKQLGGNKGSWFGRVNKDTILDDIFAVW